MLAIFHKGFAQPPQELLSPNSKLQPKHPEEILKDFHSSNSNNSFCVSFNTGAALASATKKPCYGYHRRIFSCMDELHCMFVGSLDNLSSLIRQYGLCSKSTDEAMLVIEAYRTLRDRGPYPADQVLKGLDGSFAFVVYDNKNGFVFAASSSDGEIPLFWGVAADGSAVICDDENVMKSGCGKSFAPFPNGCMFHSEGGLKSFERPMHKMKAVPRVDSEGVMSGAFFKVDSHTKISSMPIPSASSVTSKSDVGLHKHAFGTFAISTQTVIGFFFFPNGTKWIITDGSVEDTRPSATISPFSDQSINLHLPFIAEFAL